MKVESGECSNMKSVANHIKSLLEKNPGKVIIDSGVIYNKDSSSSNKYEWYIILK